MKIHAIASAALLVATVAQAQYHKYDTWDQNYTVQALLGAVKYDDLKFEVEGSEDIKVDVSTLPQLGGAWTTLPRGERFQYGLECTFLLGFKFDQINHLYLGGSGAYISLSTSMWMFDFSGGAYASLFLDKGSKIRIYAGGGPLMAYADYRSEQDYEDAGTPTVSSSESAFGLGLYARTGVEIRLHHKGMLGVGVRGNWSNMDFTEIGGSTDLSGFAGFITYTAGF
ncbi:hypothetical protein PDESU_06471 [Pontiella desulfatans]|uniref:Outer membrane protein beta-barrel domain-containing protein n=1 Tax=Pontiella desulfatans TaxID=2750659 RepID=A0A6C2UD92_PONDE|nr:hypothetical protein [Pontiella desulfatans]VGO17869.1 hypothetical protein PDESU_06471 [Pontiella desulfatans]